MNSKQAKYLKRVAVSSGLPAEVEPIRLHKRERQGRMLLGGFFWVAATFKTHTYMHSPRSVRGLYLTLKRKIKNVRRQATSSRQELRQRVRDAARAARAPGEAGREQSTGDTASVS